MRSPTREASDFLQNAWLGVMLNSKDVLFTVFGWHRFLFLAETTLFWNFYDNRKSAHISHIYQSDKYGVVISYAVHVMAEVWFARKQANLSGAVHPEFLLLSERRMDLHLFLSLCKVLAFNFIFKNHTDDTAVRQGIHISFVVGLGVITAADVFVKHGHNGWYNMLGRLMVCAGFGVTYKLFGTLAKRKKDVVLNFLSMFFESLLIASTM